MKAAFKVALGNEGYFDVSQGCRGGSTTLKGTRGILNVALLAACACMAQAPWLYVLAKKSNENVCSRCAFYLSDRKSFCDRGEAVE